MSLNDISTDKLSGPVKVLVLMNLYQGNYHLLNNMVLGLDATRFDARVCYLTGATDGKNSLDSHGKSIYLDVDGSLEGKKLKTLFALKRVVEKERPDIIHSHRHKSAIYGSMVNLLTGIGVVVAHDHGTRGERFSKLRKTLEYRLFYKRVRKLITVSEMSRQEVLSAYDFFSPEKVVTVLNGIDVDAYGPGGASLRDEGRRKLGASEGEVVFGTVGRLSPKKGHRYLLEAFATVRKQLPNSKLAIVGDGPLRKELEAQIEELDISSGVELMGHRGDVPQLLAGFDVFVFPSLSEGLPLSLLEAMAARLPAVSSAGRGIPEVYETDADFGALVPVKDSASLARAMVEVGSLSSRERQVMGEAARARVEEAFTAETMCAAIMGVYDEAIKG